MTVARMLDELTSSEITEWHAHTRDEPIGGHVEDLRAGIGPAVASNMNRAEGAPPISPFAYFPWHDKPKPKTEIVTGSPEELSMRLRALIDSKFRKKDGD